MNLSSMHIPDGFINLPVSSIFILLSLIGIAFSLRGAQKQLSEKSAPLAGLTAVFAVQMLNFPVAAGTSGHWLGGALAAVLVGPYAASLAITVVLLIQGFLFADGGLTAIGLNIFNMSIIGVWVGFGIFTVAQKLLPKNKSSVALASAFAAFLSVPAAAAGFVLQYAFGATATYSLGTVLAAMLGTHFLIGIGEAIITFLTVRIVLASRSDLVFGWQAIKPSLEIK